jgi:hypothetical protein
MKSKNKKSIWLGIAMLAVVLATVFYACKPSVGGSLGMKPVANFSTLGGGDSNSVTFVNTTTSPSIPYWIIPSSGQKLSGDSAKTRFTFAGSYNVQLVAVGQGGVDSVTKQVTINHNDPNACNGTALGFITGCGTKNWKLAPIANAEGCGPAAGNTSWWGNGSAEPTGDRVCDWDDIWTFNFNAKGTMGYNNNGTFYTNGNIGNIAIAGGGNFCDVNSDLPASQAPWASGTFNYQVIPNAGANGLGQIVLNGLGAHIGGTWAGNGNQWTVATQTQITYDIVSMTSNVNGSGHDQIVLGISWASGCWWNFTLWSY